MGKQLYLAGGLFNAGERLHLLYLEKHLIALGFEVILPQREALRFTQGEKFDRHGVAQECKRFCEDGDNIFVGCIDGTDADSGTSVEYGVAMTATGKAVVYRTDFRTVEDTECGRNAMFRLDDKRGGTQFVYHPCFFTKLDEVDEYYRSLAEMICKAVDTVCPP